ncbi:uncharacterized protein TNCV_981621 [Trichonephila clavipes]|nr:uncharacterized protein TNCV_981621 [Trichonephila clavipes]
MTHVVELSVVWNVGVASWQFPRNLKFPRVSSPGFVNDFKLMPMGVDVTQVAPELQRKMRSDFWQLLPKRSKRSLVTDLSRQLCPATAPQPPPTYLLDHCLMGDSMFP